MNVLINTLNRFNFLIGEVPQKIKNLPEKDLSSKPAPDKWSKKAILGHLCDSAVNSLSRFVRAQIEPEPFKLVSYAQDDWVRLNHWQEASIEEVLNFWTTLNKKIIQVISKIPEEKLGIMCDVGDAAFNPDGENKSLLWLIDDYVLHMEYHLRQIINEDWLRNKYMKT